MNKLLNKTYATISIFLLILLFGNAHGQNVSFTTSAPRVVEAGEQFRLSFSLNAKGKNFTAPEFKNFTVLTGPNVSSSTSVQIINGDMKRSSTYTYNYILVSYDAGKHTIEPASVEVKGKTYKSNPVSIEVIAGNSQATAGQGQQNQQQSKVSNSDVAGKDLFATVNVSNRNVYQGEKITAEIKIYTRVSIGGFEDYKFPPFSGFWSQDIEAPSQLAFHRENVNGQIYEAAVLKKSIIVPQRSGKLVIDPFTATVLVRKQVRSNNPFDDFFGGSYRNVPTKITSKPITINVKPLPESNKPASFEGAVGTFRLSANMDKDNVKTNQAINLKLNISGTGNFKFISAPKVDFPPDMDLYDPKRSENTKLTNRGVSGNLVFTYLFIPRYSGEYRIAPIKFTYFDLATKQYKTLSTQEFTFKVEKGEGEPEMNSGVVQSFTKEDVKLLGKDIRFIKTDFEVIKKQSYLFGSKLFWSLYAIPFLLFIIIIIIRRTQIKQNANQTKVKNRKANKLSRKRLKKAAGFMKQDNKEHFYDEVLKAVWGYLSDKLAIPVAELSKDNVADILSKHKVDADTVTELTNLLDTCEFARYAPTAIADGMDGVYNNAVKLISKLDARIK